MRDELLDITPEEELGTIDDPVWRLSNLYQIVDKPGNVVDFVPNHVQRELIDAIYVKKRRRHAVLKSRKHGVSTLFELMLFDWCYFIDNLQASIVDLTHGNASAKLTNIVRFAWEHLDPEIREKLEEDNKNTIRFRNGSSINAGKSVRGGQNQIIHVSEWGPIAHEDPKRSLEIKTGALPSADTGVHLIESTFKGGKGGEFYDLLIRAQQTPDAEKTDKDYWFHFFPWYVDPSNTLAGKAAWIDQPTVKYLRDKERELKVKFSAGQALWYFKMKQEQGIYMFREYPTTVDEAFSAPIEGAIYGDIISQIRARGQIVPFNWERGAGVFAAYDIGWDDRTAVWLFQVAGREILWPFHLEVRHETAAQVMQRLVETNIPIAGHLLPHDANQHSPAVGISYKEALAKAGATNIRAVPQTKNEWDGINLVRDLLQRSWFNEPATRKGIEALEAFHTHPDQPGAVIKRDPVHDWASHSASAMRTAAEAMVLGLVKAPVSRVVDRPRMPDGSLPDDAGGLVDLEAVRGRARRQHGLATSGDPLAGL